MRILFITATRVGDAVLSTGVLAHLLGQYPGARITVACGPAAAGLFEDVPGLERVIVLEKQRYSLHWLGLWLKTSVHLWDILVDMRNAPLTYVIPHKRGFHLGRSNMDAHRVVRYAAMLGLGDTLPAPQLWLSEERRKRAAKLLPDDGAPLLAIGPVANWQPKIWPAQNFVELVERLSAPEGIMPGARVAVFGTEGEREQARAVLDGIPAEQVIDLMGRIDLLDIYACMEHADLFVGNDSGLMHMAAAAGTPTVGLFGPSRESHYAPWGELSTAVRGDLGYDEIFPKDYDYRAADHLDLMSGLSVDRVEQAACALWRRAGGGHE